MRLTDWGWWWSLDGGERYRGPCATREDALEEAREALREDDETSAWVDIMKARQRIFSAADLVPQDGYEMWRLIHAWLDDAGEDWLGPDGETPFDHLTAAHGASLAAALRTAADAWHDAAGVKRGTGWTFAQSCGDEQVEIATDAEGATAAP